MYLLRPILFALLALGLSGCAWFGGDDDEVPPDQGERQLYEAAQKNIKSSNFEIAIKNLQLLEAPRINFPPDFEAYDPKVQTNVRNSEGGQTGSKTFEYLLIPRYAGNFRIAPVSFSYFDPQEGIPCLIK